MLTILRSHRAKDHSSALFQFTGGTISDRPVWIILAPAGTPRPLWSQKLNDSLKQFGVCIVRASSGQGKSTLAYRYAHDNWSDENTFVLKVARTPEQVRLITDYLRFRASVFPLLRVLVDNADSRTPLWPEVVQEVVSLGGQALITIRNEDWHRFAHESMSAWGIVEPHLDIDEARMVFKAFRDSNQIHSSVLSSEWAYERIGKPHLLMEFIYLITHGQMLEDRLRDQIKDFAVLREDPIKIEILRRVALASAFDSPLNIEKLVASLSLRDDVQQVMQPMVGEFIEIHNGFAYGLHWVRSNHLLKILFNGIANLTSTTINILEAIPQENIPTFISNAVAYPEIELEGLIPALAVEMSKSSEILILLACLDGLFAGGERLLFNNNKHLFEEAFAVFGMAGTFLLSTNFIQFAKPNIIDDMIKISEGNKTGFDLLKEISDRAKFTKRGLDLCRDFLTSIVTSINIETLSLELSGKLLHWCGLTGTALPNWENAKESMLSFNIKKIRIEQLCTFCEGLYRYDKQSYTEWFERNRKAIIGYLKVELDCLNISVDTDVSIRFLLDPFSETNVHEQTISRLEKLRQALPFCLHYCSQGIWMLPFGAPEIDETIKSIPTENLPLPQDVEKNVVWRTIVETEFSADTNYRYQEHWFLIRSKALQFVVAYMKWLKRECSGKPASQERMTAFANDVVQLIQSVPDPPSQTPSVIAKGLKSHSSRWATHLQNFIRQIYTEPVPVRLAVHNYREVVKLLGPMQDAFLVFLLPVLITLIYHRCLSMRLAIMQH